MCKFTEEIEGGRPEIRWQAKELPPVTAALPAPRKDISRFAAAWKAKTSSCS